MYTVQFQWYYHGRKEHKFSIVFNSYADAERRVHRELSKYPDVKATIFEAIATAEAVPAEVEIKFL